MRRIMLGAVALVALGSTANAQEVASVVTTTAAMKAVGNSYLDGCLEALLPACAANQSCTLDKVSLCVERAKGYIERLAANANAAARR